MCPNAPTPGTVVGGRYRLEQMLVQGGMGNVWKAHHVSLNAPVAIKFISPLIAEDDEALSRFMHEAQSAAALRSSHIVQVFDFGIDDGAPFIAMELLQGESLAERLRRVGALSALETGRILSQVARGIQYAHTTGIVHRDLKPDNIFITTEGDHEVSKVLDFGIAKSKTKDLDGHTSAQTRAGTLLGSPYYVSPEQAEGDRDIDHRSDLWALGIITFECLTGKRPFESESLATLLVKICTQPAPRPSEHAAVPSGFDQWFARAVEKDRARRFQSARDLVDGFARLLTSERTQLSEILWNSSSDSANGTAPASGGSPNANASTMTSTPHRASVNDSALAVTPKLADKPRIWHKWHTLLGAALLVLVAGGLGKLASCRSNASTTNKPPQLLVNAATSASASSERSPDTRANVARSPDGSTAALPSGGPEVTPVASANPTSGAPGETPKSITRPAGGLGHGKPSVPALGSTAHGLAPDAPRVGASAVTAPLASSPDAATTQQKDLFRNRKLPGEAP